MELIPTDNLLEADKVVDATIVLARQIDHAVDILRPLVYRVFAEKLWEGRFSSFGEYVESPEGLGKSQGYASKLKIIEEFRLKSGLSEEAISGIDYESMYLSLRAGGSPEEIVSKARSLTRAELRAERDELKDHEHEAIEICKYCGKRL